MIGENVHDSNNGISTINGQEFLEKLSIHCEYNRSHTQTNVRHIYQIWGSEQNEISGLEKIGWENHSWKCLPLIGDERVINLQRTKVYVFSDSLLCLGKIFENPESHNAWIFFKIQKRWVWLQVHSGLQSPEGKNSVLDITSAWWNRARHQWQRDHQGYCVCVVKPSTTPMTTGPPRSTALCHTAHMKFNTWMMHVIPCAHSPVVRFLSSHIVAQVSLMRVISWSSHDERISSTLSPPFPSTPSSSHFFLNLLHVILHFFQFCEGSSNTAYVAWKKMCSLDDSYLLTGFEPMKYDHMETFVKSLNVLDLPTFLRARVPRRCGLWRHRARGDAS